MRFKEFFSSSGDYQSSSVPDIKRLSNLGAVSFGKSFTNKNIIVTPHTEIVRCMEMYEQNSIVNSALNQLMLFIIPNKDIKIASKDKKTVKFLEDWHSQRSGILAEFRNILLTNVMTGNGPMEKHYSKTTNDVSVLDNIFSNNDMGRIYVNPDDLDGETAYVFELPIGVKSFRYMGVVETPQFIEVRYIKNYSWFQKRVWGITIPAWKFSIYQSGWSRDNLYGRSMLASAIDADNIMKEIMSSWDTIAKTRQVDQKLLTVDNVEGGIDIDQTKLDKLGEQLEEADKSYTLFNIPLKLVQQDIKTSGNYDTLEGVFESIRRMIMMSLLPQHLTPWSDSATTQGSEAAMPPFLGRLKSKQNEFNAFLTSQIIDELRKTYTWLAEDATYIFDEPKVLSDRAYIDNIDRLVAMGVITTNDAQRYLIKIGIIDKDNLESEEDAKGDTTPDAQKNPDDNEDQEDPEVDVDKEPADEPRIKEPSEPKEMLEVKKKEAVTKSVLADVKFSTFVSRLKNKDKNLDTKGWKQMSHKNIGGKQIRLVKADEDILLFDGLNLIQTFDLNVVDNKLILSAYEKYLKKIKAMQDEFFKGDTPEDEIIDQFERELKQELDKQLKKLFKVIGKSGRKTEDFLSGTVLGKVDGFFKDFGKNINKSINKILNKLNVVVADSKIDNVEIDDKIKKDLASKRDLFKQDLKQQMKKTKDNMLVDIQSSLRNGIAAGRDVSDIKKDIEQKFNYNDGVGWKFTRAARTQMRTAAGILKLKKLQKAGFESFIWQTREDEKVRSEHAKRNERVYSIEKALKGNMPFPGGSSNFNKFPNYNCRCLIIPYS